MTNVVQDVIDLYKELIFQLADPSLIGQKRLDVNAAAAAIEDEAFHAALENFRLATEKFNEITLKLTKAAAALSDFGIRARIKNVLKSIGDRHADSIDSNTANGANNHPHNNSNTADNLNHGQEALQSNSGTNATIVIGNAVDPTKRSTDYAFLHPLVRKKVDAIQKQLNQENIPMRVFEAFRTPERQAHLYAQGRTRAGSIVTNAEPWESYHQYGMAADFVRFENGNWNWNDHTTQQKKDWNRFHEIARNHGLEPLSFERPHVQLMGTSFAQLLGGDFPDGGDESWSSNFSEAVHRWPSARKPPAPSNVERPPLGDTTVPGGPTVKSSDWVSMFGGDQWKYDAGGVYTAAPAGGLKLWRTAGSPTTAQSILTLFGDEILTASHKHNVPASLIMMTIATETAAFRSNGFTGPKTFRWEAHVVLKGTGNPNIDGKEKGDYSAGPMQVLSNTARWMNDVHNLGYDSNTTLKYFKKKPASAPKFPGLGLYDAATCIDIGTAYIKHNMTVTGDNPLLVAAAYNAGSLRPSSANHWRVHSHGNHLDRAAEWFGDACHVLNT